jgi:hypothetical protein
MTWKGPKEAAMEPARHLRDNGGSAGVVIA